MSIQKRNDKPAKPWIVHWREEGRQRSKSFETRALAKKFEADNDKRLAGGHQASDRITVEEWLLRWAREHGPAWAKSTQVQRASLCDLHVLPYLGGAKLARLNRARLLEWRTQLLEEGRSAKTVNASVRVLSAALTAAVDAGLIDANPLLGLRTVRQEPVSVRPVPLGVVDAILAQLPTRRDQLVVGLMAFAGLRPGEVRALVGGDVGEEVIWVGRAQGMDGVKETKSGSDRAIGIRAELAQLLGADRPAGLLVPSNEGGVLVWHNWLVRVWQPALAALGLGHQVTKVVAGKDRAEWVCPYTPYSLRHTYASLWIAEGATAPEVAAEMGHSSPMTTYKHYAHLFKVAEATRRAKQQKAA